MSTHTPNIQWFPGHMAKTRRLMTENLKLVDVVIELLDARIPTASTNPEIDRLVGEKPRIVLLNKSDIADANATSDWIEYYKRRGITALGVDCRSGKGLNQFDALLRETLNSLLARRAGRGIVGQNLRMMVVGIPNVGKSSFINRLAGSRRAKVEDRPGVTRTKQWVTTNLGMELLDMPGVLWPKFDDKTVAENLAFTGAIRDDILDVEGISARLIERLNASYFPLLQKRYNFTPEEVAECDGYALLALLAKKRGMLSLGGEGNIERAAITLLDEFRGGKIGRITLELPTKK